MPFVVRLLALRVLSVWLLACAWPAAAHDEGWPAVLHRSRAEAGRWLEQAAVESRLPAQRLMLARQIGQWQAMYGDSRDLAQWLRQVAQDPLLAGDHALAVERLMHAARLEMAEARHLAAARLLAPLRRPGALPGDSDLTIRAQVLMAQVDDELGQRLEATEALTAVIRQARQAGAAEHEAMALQALADVQVGMGDYRRALDYYQEALGLTPAWAWQDLAERRMAVAQMTNIVGDRTQAFALLEPALQQFRRSQNLRGEADALLLKGYFHDKAGQPAAALPLHQQALRLRERLGGQSDIVNSLTHLASVMSDLGRPAEAVQMGEKAVALALLTDSPGLQWDAHANLADALARNGQPEQAFEQMRKSERALLKLSRLDLIGQTGALRERFETDRQALENARLADHLAFERREQQRLSLTIAVMLVLSSLLLLVLLALVRLYWRTRHLARHDGLTLLLNRRQVMLDCALECERARRHGYALAVLSFDLDDFKRINDAHGHATGDRVLREVAQVCRSTLRRGDLAGRVGGEEFLLVLPHTDDAAAMHLAERLRGLFEAQVSVAAGWAVTASFGVAVLSDGLSAEDLLHRADEALYRAKHQGRNRSELAPPPPATWTAATLPA